MRCEVSRLRCLACVLVLAGFLTLHVWLLGLPRDLLGPAESNAWE